MKSLAQTQQRLCCEMIERVMVVLLVHIGPYFQHAIQKLMISCV